MKLRKPEADFEEQDDVPYEAPKLTPIDFKKCDPIFEEIDVQPVK